MKVKPSQIFPSVPLIPFSAVDSHLAKLNLDRQWLAMASNRALSTVNNALAPSAPEYKRSNKMHYALSKAIMEAQACDTKVLLTVSKEQKEQWEEAAKDCGLDIDEWIKLWANKLSEKETTVID